MLSQHPKHMYEKINLYLADAWNFVDILSLLAFAVASVLRFFPDDFDGDLFEAARIIYILDIILFIVRSLQMFAVSRQLGPKLVMIKTMVSTTMQLFNVHGYDDVVQYYLGVGNSIIFNLLTPYAR